MELTRYLHGRGDLMLALVVILSGHELGDKTGLKHPPMLLARRFIGSGPAAFIKRPECARAVAYA